MPRKRHSGIPRLQSREKVKIPFIATIPPLNLASGQRYQWRVTIDGQMHEDWLAGFTVTP